MSQDMVTLTIDGKEVSVPKGTLIIRAAEKLGIHIPRFCDHPLLDPAGACRQCLVDVAAPDREGNVRPFPKPQASCTMTVMPGMVVNTAETSEVAKKAQHGITEFLLINHPLDCPICDKGGECPLQNQAMSHGTLRSRFDGQKRTWPKPVELTSQILIDRERCVLCQRCVRFAKQIAGDSFIALQGRGGGSIKHTDRSFMGENIGAYDEDVLGLYQGCDCAEDNPKEKVLLGPDVPVVNPLSDSFGAPAPICRQSVATSSAAEEDVNGRLFASYFSGNIIQICPVGALTSKQYRFRSRPFDLVSTRGVTEHDASGSAIRNDIRRGVITRRLAQMDMEVNEEWITDKDRFAYNWQFGPMRLTQPMVREEGELRATSWSDAIGQAAEILSEAAPQRVGFLPGGRLTFEDAYGWSKFARAVVGTNNIDQRTRVVGAGEESFLGAYIAGTGMPVTYEDLEKAGQVMLVGFEPEDECGSIFLRLRKGVRNGSVKVATVAAFESASSIKTSAQVFTAAPGTEPEILNAIRAEGQGEYAELFSGLKTENAVIVIGERAAATPGLLKATVDLAARTGARMAWVPRRAGERGGLEAGLLPALLPFGRPVADAKARAEVAAQWGMQISELVGLNMEQMLTQAAAGNLDVLVTGGIDLRDFPDTELVRKALSQVKHVISLEVNRSEVTDYASVLLPVAPPAEKNGTFINWEGRLRPFGQALVSHQLSDFAVLHRISEEMGKDMRLASLKEIHSEVNALLDWEGQRLEFCDADPLPLLAPAVGQVALVSHKPMLDDGLLQRGAKDLAASARRSVLRMSANTAAEFGISRDGAATISTDSGSITLPISIVKMPDRVVWVPECAVDSQLHESLGVASGALVSLAAAEVK